MSSVGAFTFKGRNSYQSATLSDIDMASDIVKAILHHCNKHDGRQYQLNKDKMLINDDRLEWAIGELNISTSKVRPYHTD